LARGWHIVIGGNTGQGKSLVALNLAAHAVRQGERVAFLSLEMSQVQLATRFVAIATGQTVRRLEQGADFDPDYWRAAAREMDQLSATTGGVLFTNRRKLSHLADIVSAMRYQREVNGCRYMIVDYLQLARTASRSSDLLLAIEEVSHTVRDVASDLGVVSIGLSQFNRQTSANRALPPTPQGLMGGSPLENDSDQVVLLDHSKYERDRLGNGAVTKLLLSKNRHGGQAIIDVRWSYRDLSITEITSAAPPETTPPGPRLVAATTDRGEAWEPDDAESAAFDFPPREAA
jgi:replicative DNA helicase